MPQGQQLWRQWQALQATAAASAAQSPQPAVASSFSPADKPQLHHQLPHLAQRLGQVLAPVIQAHGESQLQAPDGDHNESDQIAPDQDDAAASVDALAAEAAQRALELRGLTAKGARLRKKKALTDLLEALQAAGASRHVSAVPAAQRTVHSWFTQVGSLH